jgi:hypothetical protein
MSVPAFYALWRAFNARAGSRWCRSSRYFVVTPDSPVYTGQSGVHRTCPVNYSGLVIANFLSWRVQSRFILGALDTVRCTPDSPVNYSVAALRIPEGAKFSLESPGAPDTVLWCTGHCPVAHRTVRCARSGCLRLSLCSFV